MREPTLIFTLLLMSMTAALPARAGDAPPAGQAMNAAAGQTRNEAAGQTKDAIAAGQAVIESQIDAFLADDMATAYSFISPGVQEMYPNQERFSAMVKHGYRPVYRPGNYAFGRAQEFMGGNVIQEVMIQDTDEEDWTALYTLERQKDGSMKISGVQIIKSAPPQT